jgi:A/G-specific adenine glycosylase
MPKGPVLKPMSHKLRSENGIPTVRFRRKLLQWFDGHKRDLPWRENPNPYHTWISEIMLQQTRVTAVLEYYKRFIRRFPTAQKLAAARQSSVLAAWSGLGYYRRARMLHAAAKEIAYQWSGRLPATAAELQKLPGIGRYTAAAIASIAFDEPVAVVDGNVERLLQRLSGERLQGSELWQVAQRLLSRKRPGDFNQAMMELGATLCLPRAPNCCLCPISEMCVTRGELRHPRPRIRQRKREIRYALACQEQSVFLVQRERGATLMPGMWELPEVPIERSLDPCLTLSHSITVTDYRVQVVRCEQPAGTDGRWVQNSRISHLPLTGLTQKILRAAKVI